MRKKPFSGNFVGALSWWLLSAAWVMVLFYFSGQNGADSSQLSGNLARWLLDRMPFLNLAPAVFEHYLRKTAHFGIFAVEGFLIRVALYRTRPRKFWNLPLAMAPCALLAVANELHQRLSPGRSCSYLDMGIDTAGALAGALAGSLACWMAESLRVRRAYGELTRRQKERK